MNGLGRREAGPSVKQCLGSNIDSIERGSLVDLTSGEAS